MENEGININAAETIVLQIRLEEDFIFFNSSLSADNGKNMLFTGSIRDNWAQLFYWLLDCAKCAFERMPVQEIKVCCTVPPEQKDNPEFMTPAVGLFSIFGTTVHNTNKYLLEHAELKDSARNNKNILFYLFDNEIRMKSFLDFHSRNYPGRMFLKAYPSGWNNKLRKWEESGYRLSVEDFISTILKNNIRKVIGINNFLYEEGLKYENIFLPWILKYLGVEFIGHDIDPVELGGTAIERCAVQLEGMTRLTALPIWTREWDEHYRNKGVFYTPLIQHYTFEEEDFALQEDYSILALSQSRRDNVISQLGLILYLTDRYEGDCVFSDYQLWYLALRRILFELFEDNNTVLIKCLDILFQTMYHIAQFLKYEVIDSVKTDRRLLIYGDDGWNTLFPQYFQGIHLNGEQIAEMDRRKKYLHLMFHNSFSYLETGGPVYDAIAKNRAFINYPALARTDAYQGFTRIEYTGRKDISRLIENIREVYANQELRASIHAYKSVVKDFEDNLVGYLVNDIPYPEDGGEYYRGCKEHYHLIDRQVEEYAVKNAGFLRESLEVLFYGENIPVDVRKTKYYGRDYVQRLYAFAAKTGR